MNFFELDPAHYLSTPENGWDAMLRFIEVNLKLISDIEKYKLIQGAISGGVSMTCKGYAEANKFLRCQQTFSQLRYLIGLIQKNLIYIIDNNSSICCFLEVNLDYFDDLRFPKFLTY